MSASATSEQPDPSVASSAPAKALTVRGATVLGIGSMIGAGIFALLGEAGAVAGSAVWISFLIGGIVAGLLGYVCAKLGMRFPSSGGLITYLIEGFGLGRMVGVACWLGYIAAEVRQALREGVPVLGICLYPVMDYPGWDDNRHCPCGLIACSADWSQRSLRADLVAELRAQQSLFADAVQPDPALVGV